MAGRWRFTRTAWAVLMVSGIGMLGKINLYHSQELWGVVGPSFHFSLLGVGSTSKMRRSRGGRLPGSMHKDGDTTKELKFLAKYRDRVRQVNPEAFTITPEKRLQWKKKAEKARMKAPVSPVKRLFSRAPIMPDGEVRLRDWSDSEYESAMLISDKAKRFYSKFRHLPHPRAVAKKLKTLKKPIKWKPWDLEMQAEEAEAKRRRRIDVDEEEMSESEERLWRKLPKSFLRQIEKQSFEGEAEAHPGSLLDTTPRAHAELMMQVADQEARRDPRVAFEWYKEGARYGSIDATFKLACHYANGEVPVEANMTQAISYFKTAADAGHIRAKYFLGLSYLFGDGTKTNYTLAQQYLQSAAQEDKDAQAYVAYMYEKGLGVKKDKLRARSMYEILAAEGHKDSKLRARQIELVEERKREKKMTKPPRRDSLAYRLGGGKEREARRMALERKEIIRKREEKRKIKAEKRKNGTYYDSESTDPDDWDEERIQRERRIANDSVSRALAAEARRRTRIAKKFVQSRRNNLPVSVMADLPTVLLPSEMDNSINSIRKAWLSGRIDPVASTRRFLLGTGLVKLDNLDEDSKKLAKAKTKRAKPRSGRFYK